MDIFEEIQNAIEAFKHASADENSAIRFKKTFASGVVISFSIRSDNELPELDGLSLDELDEILDELEDKLEALKNEEPADDICAEHDRWEEKVFDLEEQIDEVESAIDDLEDIMDADYEENLDEDWED